jgi:ABC-2 type transport system permease protein
VTVIFAASIRFLLEHIIGITAFWISNTRALSDFNEMFFYFFSGALFPLSYLKNLSISALFAFLPYKYIINFPLDTLLGKNSYSNIFLGIGIQIIWILLLYNTYKLLWMKGVKVYGGYGG